MAPRGIFTPQNLNGNVITGSGTAQNASDLPNLGQVSQLVQAPVALANSTLQYRSLLIALARAAGKPQYLLGGRADGFLTAEGIDAANTIGVTAPGKVYGRSQAVDANTLLYSSMEAGLADELGHAITRAGTAGALSTTTYKFGSTSYHNVQGGYLTLPSADFAFASGSAFTFEAWVNFDSLAVRNDILTMAGFQVYVDTTGKLITNNAQADNGFRGPTMTAGTWYYLELSYTGSTAYLFLNGSLLFSYAVSPSGSPTLFGNSASPSTSFGGFIDNLRLSKIARHTAAYTAPAADYARGVLDFRSSAPLGQLLQSPTKFAGLFLAQVVAGSPVVNTDLIASVTRNGGANWLDVALTSQGSTDAGELALTADVADLSSLPAGTDCRLRFRTTAGTNVALTGIMSQYA